MNIEELLINEDHRLMTLYLHFSSPLLVLVSSRARLSLHITQTSFFWYILQTPPSLLEHMRRKVAV